MTRGDAGDDGGGRTPAQVVIGLDVGTTRVKAAAFGLGDGPPWRRTAERDCPPMPGARDQQVQDLDVVVAAARDALAETVAGVGDAEVVAVSVGAAMHGLAALDADGRPLTPLITWADARAVDEARALHTSGQAAELQARTGTPVHPMTPLTKLLWFARHDPATWRAARWWVGLKPVLLRWLTGAVVTELSSASGTGLVDMATRAWSPLALEVTGVGAERLSPIHPTTALLSLAPGAAREVGLPAGTPVVAGAADGPLGNVGTGALAPGVAGLSLGTSGAVRLAVDAPRPDPTGHLFCYALTEETWVVGGTVSNGGSILRWAGRELAPDLGASDDGGRDAAVADLAAGAPPGCDGLVMLPYLLPERAPLWDPDLPGAYLGLRTDHTRTHLLRAAVEGVALQLRIVLDELDEVDPVTSVRATGGALRSPLWREVTAAMLGRPLHVVDGVQGTALGAAALGLVALGRAPSLAEAADQLAGDGAPPPPVPVDREAAAVYERLRASIPDLIHRLEPVARLVAGLPPSSSPPASAPSTHGGRRPAPRGDR